MLLLVLSGCVTPAIEIEQKASQETSKDALKETLKETLVVIHGGGGGHWLPNSRNAVINSVQAFKNEGYSKAIHAIEVDVVLTQDQQLVLSHDPWVNKELCVTSEGNHPGHSLIKNLSLREIQQRYVCGHRALEDFPKAEAKPESIMSVEEMLLALIDTPDLAIYLDVKIQEEATAGEVAYARAIEEVLDRVPVQNEIYIEGPTVEALHAYRSHITHSYQSILSYPPFYAGENWTLVGALALVKTYFNADLPIEQAQEVAANFVSSPVQILSRSAVQGLQDQQIGVILYTANDEESFEQACQLGPDFIITDYPELAPC
ncbi:MAG: glycerophosphodiester phosphodiesterase [Pseudohongiellaceae bacterium]